MPTHCITQLFDVRLHKNCFICMVNILRCRHNLDGKNLLIIPKEGKEEARYRNVKRTFRVMYMVNNLLSMCKNDTHVKILRYI